MKLRNKKTGKIVELEIHHIAGKCYESLAEVNEEWEDYEDDEYYYAITSIKADDGITKMKNKHNDMTAFDKSIGNYFLSREEAEKAVEKLKAWERLESLGFKFRGWRTADLGADKYYFVVTAESDGAGKSDLDLLFGGEE